MANKTDYPVSSSSYSSGDEAESATSVADSDCNTAIKVINKLMPDMMELIHLEINVVLSKAYSAGFVGKEMLDKGMKNDPKQVARQFIDAACTQIKMNSDVKGRFEAFLDIFRDITSLETIAQRIEVEMKAQKPKLKKKKKKLSRKKKELPVLNLTTPEACSYSSGFDETSTRIATGDEFLAPPQQVLNKSVATENPSGDQNSGTLTMVSASHSGAVTHTKCCDSSEAKGTSSCDLLNSEVGSIEETSTSSTENRPTAMVISTEKVAASYEEFNRNFSDGQKKMKEAVEEMIIWNKTERTKLKEELQKRSQDLQECRKHICAKQQEIENLKDSCDSQIEELIANHKVKIKKMENECAIQNNKLEDLKVEFDQHRSDAKNRLECLKGAHLKEMKEEQEKHEKEKEKLKSKYEKEITRLKEAVVKEQREAELKKEILKLRSTVQEQKLTIEYEEKMSKIKEKVKYLELNEKELEKQTGIQKAEMEHQETRMQFQKLCFEHQMEQKENQMKIVRHQQQREEELGSQAARSSSDSASNTSMSVSIEQTLMLLNLTQSSDMIHNVPELHSDNSKSS